uniref:CSD domain-containing protein n=1 Tax=viral metagenome TaxID=1070528 RepID=A0A6C0B6Y3_9ZZZZ
MSTTERALGQVKWFNNKAGYGFITMNDSNDENAGKDIFVHYSSIRVTNSQYKYLTQGEYVEFSLEKSTSEKHELQANDVSGVKGGKLMCEVRRTVYSETDRRPVRSYRRFEDDREQQQEQQGEDDFKKVQRKRPAVRKPRVVPTPSV